MKKLLCMLALLILIKPTAKSQDLEPGGGPDLAYPCILSLGVISRLGISLQYQHYFWKSENNWKFGGQFSIERWPHMGDGFYFVGGHFSGNTGVLLAKGDRHNMVVGMNLDYNWSNYGNWLPSPSLGYAFVKPNAFYFGLDLRVYAYPKGVLADGFRRFPTGPTLLFRFGRSF